MLKLFKYMYCNVFYNKFIKVMMYRNSSNLKITYNTIYYISIYIFRT